MSAHNRPLEAYIKGSNIIIEMPIANIQSALNGGVDAGSIDEMYRVHITEPKVFAEAVADALNEEYEDGTTLVHKLFDQAFQNAVDEGAQGYEDVTDEDEV